MPTDYTDRFRKLQEQRRKQHPLEPDSAGEEMTTEQFWRAVGYDTTKHTPVQDTSENENPNPLVNTNADATSTYTPPDYIGAQKPQGDQSLINMGITTAEAVGHTLGLPQRALFTTLSQPGGMFIGDKYLPPIANQVDLPEHSKGGFGSWKRGTGPLNKLIPEWVYTHQGVYPSDLVQAALVNRYERETGKPASKARRWTAVGAGLVGDVALDPLNFVAFGAPVKTISATKKADTMKEVTGLLADLSKRGTGQIDTPQQLAAFAKNTEQLERAFPDLTLRPADGPLRTQGVLAIGDPHALQNKQNELLEVAKAWDQADRGFVSGNVNRTADEAGRQIYTTRKSEDYTVLQTKIKEIDKKLAAIRREKAGLESLEQTPEVTAQVAEKGKEISNLEQSRVLYDKDLQSILQQKDFFKFIPDKSRKIEPGESRETLYDLISKTDKEEILGQLARKSTRRQILDKEVVPVSARMPFIGESEIPIGGWKNQQKLFASGYRPFSKDWLAHLAGKKESAPFTIPAKPEKPSRLEYVFKTGMRGRAGKTYLYNKEGNSVTLADLENVQRGTQHTIYEMTNELKERLLQNSEVETNPAIQSQIRNALETGTPEAISVIENADAQKAVKFYLERIKALGRERGIPQYQNTVRWIPGELRVQNPEYLKVIENLRANTLTESEIHTLNEALYLFYNKTLSTEQLKNLTRTRRDQAVPEILQQLGIDNPGLVDRINRAPLVTPSTMSKHNSVLNRLYNQAEQLGIPVIRHNLNDQKQRILATLVSEDYIPTGLLNSQYEQMIGVKPYVEDVNVVLKTIPKSLNDNLVQHNTIAKAIKLGMAKKSDDALGHLDVTRITSPEELRETLSNSQLFRAGDVIDEGGLYLYDLNTGDVVEKLTRPKALELLENGKQNLQPTQQIFYIPPESHFRLRTVQDRLTETLGETAFERAYVHPATYGFKTWIMSMPGPIIRNMVGDIGLLTGAGVKLGSKSWNKAIRKAFTELDSEAGKYLREAEALNLVGSGRRGFAELGGNTRNIGYAAQEVGKKERAASFLLHELPTKIGVGGEFASANAMRVAAGIAPGKAQDPSRVLRLAGYIYYRENGYPAKRAADLIRTRLVDYSDATRSEQRIFKQLIPFYQWLRRGNVQAAKKVVQYPGSYNKPFHIQRAAENLHEEPVNQSDLSDQTRAGVGVRLWNRAGNSELPQYMRTANWTPEGSIAEVLNAVFPNRELDEKVYEYPDSEDDKANSFLRKLSRFGVRTGLGAGRYVAGGMTPLIKVPYEASNNARTASFGTWPIEKYAGQAGPEHYPWMNRFADYGLQQIPPAGQFIRAGKRLQEKQNLYQGVEEPVPGDWAAAIGSFIGFTPVLENIRGNRFSRIRAIRAYKAKLMQDAQAAMAYGDEKRYQEIMKQIARFERFMEENPLPPELENIE